MTEANQEGIHPITHYPANTFVQKMLSAVYI